MNRKTQYFEDTAFSKLIYTYKALILSGHSKPGNIKQINRDSSTKLNN